MKKSTLFLLAICFTSVIYGQIYNTFPANTPFLTFSSLNCQPGNPIPSDLSLLTNAEKNRYCAVTGAGNRIKTLLLPSSTDPSAQWLVYGSVKMRKDFFTTNNPTGQITTVTVSNAPAYTVAKPRMVVVRPNNSNTNLPCVVLSQGGGFLEISGPEIMYYQAADLAMRGYVAIFYEYRTGWACADAATTKRNFEKAVYRAFQDGVAAIQFARANRSVFGISSTNIFALGTSAAAFNALNMGYADNDRFSSTFTNEMGGFTSRSLHQTQSRLLKGVVSISGGDIDNSISNNTIIGALLSATDAPKDIATLFLHGKQDPLIPYHTGSMNFSALKAGCPGSITTNGAYDVSTKMDALGLKNYVISTCTGGHGFIETEIFFPGIAAARQIFDMQDMVAFFLCARVNNIWTVTAPNNKQTMHHQNNIFVNTPPFGYFVAGGCSANETNTEMEDRELSDNALLQSEDFSLSPNPTTGYVNLVLSGENAVEDVETTVRLFNSVGQIMLQETFVGNQKMLDINQLPNGIYVISLQKSNGNLICKRIIKCQ